MLVFNQSIIKNQFNNITYELIARKDLETYRIIKKEKPKNI